MNNLNDLQQIREQFPALARRLNGETVVYFDGPGGTQMPQQAISAMTEYLSKGGSNTGGVFSASQYSDAVVAEARQAMADLLNCQPKEVVFGQNMTSLVMSFSRALANSWQAGDEIIVTKLDHDANISPWLLVAEDHDLTVKWLEFDPVDCTLRLEQLPDLITDRTKLVAVTLASNAVGSITDIEKVVQIAHAAGVQVFADAVHYGPHGIIDVQAWDVDYLACSAYKFFGPHTGIFYGKYDLLESLTPYKVRPAYNKTPDKWETGTQSFESLAGVTAAIDYMASLTPQTGSRRERLVAGLTAVKQHEMHLAQRFLEEATQINGLRVYGITDIERVDERTPTFAISLEGMAPQTLAEALAEQGIFVWSGHYYAIAIMEALGLLDKGGLVRIGFVHYNTEAELKRLMDTLKSLTK